MADDGGGLGGVILLAVGLFILFIGITLATGGANLSIGIPALPDTPQPELFEESGETPEENPVQNGEEAQEAVEEERTESRYEGLVTLSRGGATRRDPQEEYVTIRASSRLERPVIISGWSLENARDEKIIRSGPGGIKGINTGVAERVTVPTGTYVVSPRGNNQKEPIELRAGETAYIITGESPDAYPVLLNTSFKINKCTGYFSETFRFTPSLSRSGCPDPEAEAAGLIFDDDCYDFIERLGRCRDPLRTSERRVRLEEELTNQCRAFLDDAFDYDGCVARHRHDEDFLGDTWYIYLGRPDRELWADRRETITLYDREGKIVDQVSYD